MLGDIGHVQQSRDGHRRMEPCRRQKDKVDVAAGAKAKRMKARHLGIRKATGRPLPGTKASGWRKPFNGPPERRT